MSFKWSITGPFTSVRWREIPESRNRLSIVSRLSRAVESISLMADIITKSAPVAVIAFTALLTWIFQWQVQGLKVVGTVPQGLPPLSVPLWDLALWKDLAVPALLISVVGFVESVSVGQTLAAKRRQRIEPDQELVALGASNLSSSLTGGFPVTGGFSRSVVNFDSGAKTPAAGAFTAIGIASASLLLTPALFYLPQAVLSATIIVTVMSLVDFSILKKTWAFSKTDFIGALTTLLVTLSVSIEIGLMVGVGASLALFLYKASRPHIAEVGLVPGTEHFKNIRRHSVLTSPRVVSLRVDESLYFANSRALEDRVNDAVANTPDVEHIVLQCSADLALSPNVRRARLRPTRDQAKKMIAMSPIVNVRVCIFGIWASRSCIKSMKFWLSEGTPMMVFIWLAAMSKPDAEMKPEMTG